MKKIFLVAMLMGLFVFSKLAIATPIVDVNVTITYDSINDVYTYSYQIENYSNSTDAVGIFDLFPDAAIFDIVSPTGWDYIVANNWIEWYSISPDYDILPGNSNSGFSFKSYASPGIINYDVGAWGAPYPDEYAFGRVQGPVPEPATILLMGIALSALILLQRTKLSLL